MTTYAHSPCCAASQFALLGRSALLAPPLLHPASWSRTARFVADAATIVLPTILAPLCRPDKALLFCGACLAAAALRRGTIRQAPQLELAHLNESHPVALTNLRALVMLQVRARTHLCDQQHSQLVSHILAHCRRCSASSRSTIPSSRGASQRREPPRRPSNPPSRLSCHLGLAPPCVSRPTRGGTA